MKKHVSSLAAAIFICALPLVANSSLAADCSSACTAAGSATLQAQSHEQRFRQQVAAYASSATDVTVAIPQGFSVTSMVFISGNPHGAKLTITSASPENPATLKRGFGGAGNPFPLINVGPGADVHLKDIVIHGNKEEYRTSGQLIIALGRLTLHDGAVIRDNMNVGVSVLGGVLTMDGGEISHNAAEGGTGGGVGVLNGDFTMNGGKITGNSALAGGGVYVGGGRHFTMSGGEISDNTAVGGGGVYVLSGSKFSRGEKAVIRNNFATDGGRKISDVYFDE